MFVDPLDDLLATPPTDEARSVLRVLAELAVPSPTVRVLATIRDDRLPALGRLPSLASALGPGLFLLAEPATESAWREIIAGPARRAGRPLPAETITSLADAAVRGEISLAAVSVRLAALWSG